MQSRIWCAIIQITPVKKILSQFLKGVFSVKKPAARDYAKVVECVKSYYESFGEIPTTGIVSENTGVSRSAVGRFMKMMMEDEILIRKEKGKKKYLPVGPQTGYVSFPVIGKVSCGLRKLAVQEALDQITIPLDRGISRGAFFFLIADGESMINAGIEPGDYVLVRQQPVASPGDIVVALVGDEATLKRYDPHLDEGYVDLVPENDTMEVQRIDLAARETMLIQGVAVRVMKIRALA